MFEKIKNALRKNPFVVQTYRKVNNNWPSRTHIKKWYQRHRLERQNRLQGGVPVPKGELIFLVDGTDDAEWFLRSGRYGAQSLRDILLKNGIQIENFHAILDFGCGVGRVLRYWKNLRGPEIYGTDYNPKLIQWCQANIPFGKFQVNKLKERLEYEDEKFDFIYALSVFTHMTESQQFLWINELSRVLKPGGYLFITTHGDHYLDYPGLSPEDQIHYREGELVVLCADHEGSNQCAAFHPQSYVRERMARNLSVIDFVPKGATGNPHQDVYLLRKPPVSA
jgi:2-polyprenyl-3-methyl-5-hydroxy-6-metoxy-1,4-benzoquinol methylase